MGTPLHGKGAGFVAGGAGSFFDAFPLLRNALGKNESSATSNFFEARNSEKQQYPAQQPSAWSGVRAWERLRRTIQAVLAGAELLR